MVQKVALFAPNCKQIQQDNNQEVMFVHFNFTFLTGNEKVYCCGALICLGQTINQIKRWDCCCSSTGVCLVLIEVTIVVMAD